MNPKDLLEAYLLKYYTNRWHGIDDELKARMFNYIMSVCIVKNLNLATKIIRMAQTVPNGVTWAQHRSYLLDRHRTTFCTNKKSLYDVIWFAFPVKIKESEINMDAIEYGLKCLGKSHELQEILNGSIDKKFMNWCVEEYNYYKKYN